MSPERWQRVKQIFDSALEYAPEQRSAFLAGACGDDEDLRREVESLIASHEKTGTFIDSPAYEAAAHLIADEKAEFKPGQVVGSYEIVSFISRGGMGEVYLAQDRRLNRKVALKILPVSFTRNMDRLRRFEQEARAASALNHPNIITIYEILKTNLTHVIATEFVEGETLRQRLARGRVNLNESLFVAIHVADALAAAHAAGIVHRDIKPENIMIRPDGYVKVLDFGLAKLAEPSIAVATDEALTKQVRTGSGMILGTAGYMSPEQARGKDVDARSDIFSLGSVIYEMVTGRKPFDGETPSDTLAAILNSNPGPITDYLPQAPPELSRILTKALRKDREQRYQVVKDLVLDLKSLKEELDFQAKLDRSVSPDKTAESSSAISQPQSLLTEPSSTNEIKSAVSTITHSLSAEIKRHKAGSILALTALIVAVSAGVYGLYKLLNRSRPAAPASTEAHQVLRTTQVTFSPGLNNYPALSPDGNSIAYSSDQSGGFEIYVKQLTTGGREIQLTSDGQQNFQAAWSPDGQRIAYYSKNRGGIWLVPAQGGVPTQLTQFGSAPAWSHDGSLVAFQSNPIVDLGAGAKNALPPSTIWIVSSQGETPRQLTQIGSPPGGHGAPSWSPDGNRIVFAVDDFLTFSVWSVSVKGDDLRCVSDPEIPTLAGATDPVYSPDGQSLYYVLGLSLWNIRVSQNGEPLGQAAQVAGAAPSFIRHPTISADGKKIAYAALSTPSDLWSLPISPSSHAAAGPPTQLTVDRSQRHVLPAFSPDGKKIAFGQFRAGPGSDIWMVDADGKNTTQLTTDPARENVPSWFPEGDRIAFLSDRNSQYMRLWSTTLAGGRDQFLIDLGPGVEYFRLSPNGKRVAFNSKKSGNINIWTASLDGGQPTQLTFDKELAGFPCWSPDGQFIAFEMKRGDDNYLEIIPSSGGEVMQLINDHGLSWPHSWSPDGDKIAFVGFRNGYWNVYWVSRTTKEQNQLTNYKKLNAYVRYAAWSPLGNQIVYEYAETTGNIWLMELK